MYISWTSHPRSSTLSNVSSRPRSSSVLSFTPRERRLSLNTTLSWLRILRTESSCSREHQPSVQQLHRTSSSCPLYNINDRLCRPQSLLTGMNKFLASLEITFRRDPTNYRPRVNKAESVKDREQKGKLPPFIEPALNSYSGWDLFLPGGGLVCPWIRRKCRVGHSVDKEFLYLTQAYMAGLLVLFKKKGPGMMSGKKQTSPAGFEPTRGDPIRYY